jgi:CRISPR system Cascade subunit CasB
MSQPTEGQIRFIAFLYKLAGLNKEGKRREPDRGALARLRRGLGREPGTDLGMIPYVAPFVRAKPGSWEERCYYMVASLFAAHWEHCWDGQPEDGPWQRNLGRSFARLAAKEKERLGKVPPSIEQRFTALLNCRADDLHVHLRHAVSLMHAREIPVDWAQLLHDVIHWEDRWPTVQKRWAAGFWGTDPDEPTKDNDADESDEE